jgi:hypothetical protein
MAFDSVTDAALLVLRVDEPDVTHAVISVAVGDAPPVFAAVVNGGGARVSRDASVLNGVPLHAAIADARE